MAYEHGLMLNIGNHISIKFTKNDVGHVFGIPCIGKRVVDSSNASRDAKEFVMRNFLSTKFWDQKSVKVVQEILEQDYSLPMSRSEIDNFKVAFVVFVVSNLLAPCAKHDYASIDYWNAIREPDQIGSYDWAEFVILRLLEGVSKLKQDAANNIKYPNMTGCVTFSQVFYLDSIWLGNLSGVQKCLPRVKVFTHDKLRAMIAADNNYRKYVSGDDDISPSKLRDPGGCIYSWAAQYECSNGVEKSALLFSIWEAAVAMVHLLNIPLEAAGPVFVAAADFQRQINAGLRMSGLEAINMMSVMVSIMTPYSRGFRYHPPYGVDATLPGFGVIESAISNGINLLSSPICVKFSKKSRPTNMPIAESCYSGRSSSDYSVIGGHVDNSINAAIAALDGRTHFLDVDLRVATAMSQFYLILRKMKSVRQFDLNEVDVVGDSEASCSSSSSDVNITTLPSPWDLGYTWPSTDCDARYVDNDFDLFPLDERSAIIHRIPRYIQVPGSDLRVQLSGSCEFDLDLFDALIRTARQDDDLMYSKFGRKRWRLFFESDFMESILSGSSEALDMTLRSQLSMMCPPHDVSLCKLLFFPALIQHSWVCFVWYTQENVIYVFEPSYLSPVSESRLRVLERCCYKLKLALQLVYDSFMPNLPSSYKYAELRLLTMHESVVSPTNLSGATCYYFLWRFDGLHLKPLETRVDPIMLRASMLWDLMRLKENSGYLADSSI